MNPAFCSHCGQALPKASAHLTPRELDVLTYWWMVGSVKAAASMAGVGEQRAKNMLSAARIRNRAESNEQLVSIHFVQVRSHATELMLHNSRREAA